VITPLAAGAVPEPNGRRNAANKTYRQYCLIHVRKGGKEG
jgi:hypothetical protein